jgi:hypothetical protein
MALRYFSYSRKNCKGASACQIGPQYTEQPSFCQMNFSDFPRLNKPWLFCEASSSKAMLDFTLSNKPFLSSKGLVSTHKLVIFPKKLPKTPFLRQKTLNPVLGSPLLGLVGNFRKWVFLSEEFSFTDCAQMTKSSLFHQ